VIFLKRSAVAVAFAALMMSMTVPGGDAAVVSGPRPAPSIPHPAVVLIAAAGSDEAAAKRPGDDSWLSLLHPYLEQVRPYLAPVEAFLREQASAFKTFVMENLPSGMGRGEPRAVIDLPPK